MYGGSGSVTLNIPKESYPKTARGASGSRKWPDCPAVRSYSMPAPDFIVIGAKKTGTTSLYRYLDLHPEIAMARPRELNYFIPGGARASNFGPTADRDSEWYFSRFDPGAYVRGESSPGYASYPLVTGIPKRMHALCPSAKLLYLVRDPVERMISEYAHIWGHRHERRTISEVFSDPNLANTHYVARGRYYMQIEQFVRYFDTDRLLVVAQEHLRTDRQETLDRIFEFLGVDGFRHEDFGQEHNIARDRRRAMGIAKVSKLLFGPFNPAWVVFRSGRVKDALSRPMPRHVLDPPVAARVADYFRADAQRLRAFTGQSFDAWSV